MFYARSTQNYLELIQHRMSETLRGTWRNNNVIHHEGHTEMNKTDFYLIHFNKFIVCI
jgi:hypothetical protein